MIMLMIVGACLRFYGLGTQSFWNDELASWVQSSYGDLGSVLHGLVDDVHPPGYQIILFYVEKYIGDSEFILRFPSAICGVLSIPAIYFLAKRLYGPREGLIAAAFMTVMWNPIFFSQEARAYSMLLLLATVTMYFWISLLDDLVKQRQPARYVTISYIFTAIICCYLHYFGLYLVALQGLAAVLLTFRKRRHLIYVLLIYLPVMLAYLPWLPMMLMHLHIKGFWIERPSITTAIHNLLYMFSESWSPLVVVPLMILFAVPFARGLLGSSRDEPRISFFSGDLLLLLWLTVPLAIVYAKSLLSTSVVTSRNLIILVPAVYILLARSITQLPIKARHQTLIACAFAAFCLVHLVFNMGYYSTPQKEQFREAVAYIADHDDEYRNSLIIGFAHHGDAYFNYYFKRLDSPRRIDLCGGVEDDIPKVARSISSLGPRYIWFIRGHRVPDPQFIDFLKKRLMLIDHKAYKDTDVWLFKIRA